MARPGRLTGAISALAVLACCSLGWYALNRTQSHEKVWTGLVDVTETRLGPKYGGRLVEITANEGDVVESGQVVVRLDRRELEEQLAGAEAALLQAQGQRDEIAARLRQAEHDLDHIRELSDSGRASNHEHERTRNERDALEARLRAADAQVEVHRASIATVRQQLAETTVTATMSGRVMLRAYEPGEVVPPGGTVLCVADLAEVWIYVFVDEVGVAHLKTGDAADWRPALGDGPGGTARVVSILPEAAFATQKDKGRAKRDIKSYRVKLRAENSRELLKPGMTLDVIFRHD